MQSPFSHAHRWHLSWMWGGLRMQHDEYWSSHPSWRAATFWLPAFAGQQLTGITQAGIYRTRCSAGMLGSVSSPKQSGKLLRCRLWFWACSKQLINEAKCCKASAFQISESKMTKSSFTPAYPLKKLFFFWLRNVQKASGFLHQALFFSWDPVPKVQTELKASRRNELSSCYNHLYL